MHSPNVVDVQRLQAAFSSTVAMFGEDVTLTGADVPERVLVVFRSAGWNETLGVRPVTGRDFTPDEEARGRDSGVALVSERLWRARLGATRDLAAASLHLDGRPVTVIGVMPAGFRFPYEADVWVPVRVDASDASRDYAVFARLRDGVTRTQAGAALAALSANIRRDRPDSAARLRHRRSDAAGKPARQRGWLGLRAGIDRRLPAAARVASTSRRCCWRAPSPGAGSSCCAWCSAPAAGVSCGRCSSRRCCSRSPAARSDCCWPCGAGSSPRDCCHRTTACSSASAPRRSTRAC